ncbi:MAG: substrate-binding domain-containing protein [Candidatus Limnocylindria bacterium]
MNRNWWRSMLGVSTVLVLVLAACSTGTGEATATPDASTDAESDAPASMADGGTAVEGFVSIHGSSTVEPISTIVAEDFAAANDGFDYEVGGEGTGDGFGNFFCPGTSDISDASRPIKDEEAQTCADNGVDFVELKVGYDGITVLTSPENDAVSCLSFLDLYALLGPESEGFDNWTDANDLAAELEAELGGDYGATNAPYPDAALDITAPGEESGTFDTFVELVIAKIAEARGTDGTTRADYTASANDNVIVEGIEGSPTSLGWVGYAFYEENQDLLKAIEVDGGDGCTAVSNESISDGSYPLSRPLFIYPNTGKLADNPALAPFVDYYLNDGYGSVSEAGYVALPDDELEATKTAWAEAQ